MTEFRICPGPVDTPELRSEHGTKCHEESDHCVHQWSSRKVHVGGTMMFTSILADLGEALDVVLLWSNRVHTYLIGLVDVPADAST